MTVIVYLLIWMIISWIYSLCETLLRGTYNTCKLYSVHVLLTYISFCCFFLRSIFNTVKISVLIEYSMVLHGVGYHFLFVLVPQSCLTLCNPMDCSLHGFSAHGILQARILEQVAISFSGDLPNPGIESGSPELKADSLPYEPQGKPHLFFFLFESGKIIQLSATTKSD